LLLLRLRQPPYCCEPMGLCWKRRRVKRALPFNRNRQWRCRLVWPHIHHDDFNDDVVADIAALEERLQDVFRDVRFRRDRTSPFARATHSNL